MMDHGHLAVHNTQGQISHALEASTCTFRERVDKHASDMMVNVCQVVRLTGLLACSNDAGHVEGQNNKGRLAGV